MAKWLFGAMGMRPAFAAAGAGEAPSLEQQNRYMHFAGGSGSSASRYTSYSSAAARSREPQKKPGLTRRAIVALVLLVLLPPAGIAYMWYKGIFQLRGRVLLTVLSTLLMMGMLVFLMPETEVLPTEPVPVKASLRSPLPTDASLNALSNMEELLAGVETQRVVNTDLNEVTGLTSAESEEILSATTDPLQEVVYCVTVDAKYYHKESECRGQANKRMLTVAQAISEGLSPCKRCEPPTAE